MNSTSSDLPSLRPFERLFVFFLRKLNHGCLKVEFPSGSQAVIGDVGHPPVEMRILEPAFFVRVFRGGDVGFGEAYVEGFWTTPDLSALLKLLAENRHHMGGFQKGFSLLTRQWNLWTHRIRRNTLKRSRRNIREHYDLGNDFYRQFLDRTMTYSSARFDSYDESLEAAQLRKMDRILDFSGVRSGQKVLEIGTGWGALAIRAARRGCHVTTITLSDQQYAYARERFAESGTAAGIDLYLQDYRELQGRFDAVVSCEMIEAVGKAYLADYFRKIRDCLKPDAFAVIQAITIPDERYEDYVNGCDWIQKHIFPGGHLPSPDAIRQHVDEAGGMKIISMEAFGRDYAETLRRWADAFNRNRKAIEKLGFDECFRRKWNYYLSYCEAGFDTGLIDVRHVIIQAV